MKTFQSSLLLIGRIAISLIFFSLAYEWITHWNTTVLQLSNKGIPQTSMVLFFICILGFFGAVSLVLGYKTRWGALALTAVLVFMTFLFHDFWNSTGAKGNYEYMIFLYNTAVFGGLLYVSVTGAGDFALD